MKNMYNENYTCNMYEDKSPSIELVMNLTVLYTGYQSNEFGLLS